MRFRHLARLSTAAAASSSESADIQRLARSILSAARETGNRRKLFRTKAPLDDLAAHERDLADAIAIFDDGVRRGVALHDRDTTSLLARACVVPHAKWENRERRRALFLFDCTQRRRLLNDSLLDDAGLPTPPTRWQCEVDSNEIARFGDAADGYARASEAHRLPNEVRVDLSAVAINAIADSVIVDGSELPRGASLYEYLAHAGAGQRGELRHQALWRYFGACASRRVLPLEAMPLLEHILAAKDRQTLDAYIQACARSGNVDEAFTAHERSLLTPDHPPPNGHTITALVAACSSANQLDRAFAIVDSGRRYFGLPVDTDVHIVSALLKACAVAREPGMAQDVYSRSLEAGLVPDRAVGHARALALAANGQLEPVSEMLENARLEAEEAGLSTTDPIRAARDEDTALATIMHTLLRKGEPQQALDAFDSLCATGYKPRSTGPHAALMEATAATIEAADESGSVFALARVTRLTRIYDDAISSGIAADSRLLSSLMNSCNRLGEPKQAMDAFLNSRSEVAAPDVHVLRAALYTCLDLRFRRETRGKASALLRRINSVAKQHSLPLRGVSDLMLRAHVACAPFRPSTSDNNPSTSIDAALNVYHHGREQNWDQTVGARRGVLTMCARHDRVEEALDVLQHLQEDGIEPGFEALDELMRACRRRGDIDEETLSLWLGTQPSGLLEEEADEREDR